MADETPLEASRGLYFTHRNGVENALAKGADDAAALEKLSKAALGLSRAAVRLRHNLPSRATDTPRLRPGAYRYFVVYPDGEIAGHSYYMQRPAAVRQTRMLRDKHPELRLWDDREKCYIDVE